MYPNNMQNMVGSLQLFTRNWEAMEWRNSTDTPVSGLGTSPS